MLSTQETYQLRNTIVQLTNQIKLFPIEKLKYTKKIAGKLLTLLSGRYIVSYNIILGRLDVVYRPK